MLSDISAIPAPGAGGSATPGFWWWPSAEALLLPGASTLCESAGICVTPTAPDTDCKTESGHNLVVAYPGLAGKPEHYYIDSLPLQAVPGQALNASAGLTNCAKGVSISGAAPVQATCYNVA